MKLLFLCVRVYVKTCTKCKQIKEDTSFAPKEKYCCRSCKTEYMKKYRQTESSQQARKKNYLRQREKYIAYSKEYKKNNPEKIKAYKQKMRPIWCIQERERRKTDLRFRLTTILRRRLNHFVKGKLKGRTMELLGCDIDTFIKHIESQFTEKMIWGNYGPLGWHIDHIKPCCTFNLLDIEEQKKCFHYTNLRPLWYWENCSRGLKQSI